MATFSRRNEEARISVGTSVPATGYVASVGGCFVGRAFSLRGAGN